MLKYIIDEWRRDFTTQGRKIYRPRPKAEVCKFFSPRGVKSIDDRADIRQCYSHVRYYLKNNKPITYQITKNFRFNLISKTSSKSLISKFLQRCMCFHFHLLFLPFGFSYTHAGFICRPISELVVFGAGRHIFGVDSLIGRGT